MLQVTDRAAEVRCQDAAKTINSSARGQRVLLSSEERSGLRRILDNPKTPTEALQTAVSGYRQSMGRNSE